MLHTLEMGMILSFFYDLLRVLRRLIAHNLFWISAEDLIFWLICGNRFFLLLQRESDGIIRWFAVCGAAAGIFLYQRFFSPHFIRLTTALLKPVFVMIGRGMRWLNRHTIGFMKKRLTQILKVLKMKLNSKDRG